MNPALGAILSPPQLERFAIRFGLELQQLEVNVDGFYKVAVLSADRVFLFPRDLKAARSLEREIMAYERLALAPAIPTPRLVERVSNRSISYSPLAVVQRLAGVPLSRSIDVVDLNVLTTILGHLAKLIAGWHEFPISTLPEPLQQPRAAPLSRPTAKNWLRYVVGLSDSTTAVDWAARFFHRHLRQEGSATTALWADTTLTKWAAVLNEIAQLEPVFLHGDIHEDQILIDPSEPSRITGILDWATASVGNPIWDFNFGEWGAPIWRRREHFPALHHRMWRTYVDRRGLHLATDEGLGLLFAIGDLIWGLHRRDDPIVRAWHGNDTGFKRWVDQLIETSNRL